MQEQLDRMRADIASGGKQRKQQTKHVRASSSFTLPRLRMFSSAKHKQQSVDQPQTAAVDTDATADQKTHKQISSQRSSVGATHRTIGDQ